MTIEENNNALSDKSIWIIDDEIPVDSIEYEHDDIISGLRPIDRGTLLSLLSDSHKANWGDEAVREICEEIIKLAKEVHAFTQPTAAVLHLRHTAMVPDLIIFDLKYRGMRNDADVTNCLKEILQRSISIVQVYTQEDINEATEQLKILQDDFKSRLQAPLNKKDTKAQDLARIVGQKIESSLSTSIAGKIRFLTSEAIENVLVKIDDLPLFVAMKLLAGNDINSAVDAELVEFLAVKIAEQIKTTPELKSAVEQYALAKGVAAENINNFVSEMVELLVSQIRERIQYEEWLYKIIREAWDKANAANLNNDQTTDNIIRNFFSYRIYDNPSDPLVRTGDIVIYRPVDGNGNPIDVPEELYIILTPPCDLHEFLKKTRGILTMAKLYPMSLNSGLQKIKSFGNSNNLSSHIGSSLTARNPIYIPSVNINGHLQDYCLFAHEVTYKECDNPELRRPENNKKPLSYGFLPMFTRPCRVSEPFLSGIISKIGDTLLRTGIPDMPDREIERLKNLDK